MPPVPEKSGPARLCRQFPSCPLTAHNSGASVRKRGDTTAVPYKSRRSKLRSIGQADTAKQGLESRVGTETIVTRIHLKRGEFVGVLRISFFEPGKLLILVSQTSIGPSDNSRIDWLVLISLKQLVNGVAGLRCLARAPISIGKGSPIPWRRHFLAILFKISACFGKHSLFHKGIMNEGSAGKIGIHLQHRTPLVNGTIILT